MDHNELYAWLRGASWRHTTLDQRKLVERLIAEGRAEWVNRWNRARAIPNPAPKKKRDYKAENARLRKELDAAREMLDHATQLEIAPFLHVNIGSEGNAVVDIDQLTETGVEDVARFGPYVLDEAFRLAKLYDETGDLDVFKRASESNTEVKETK